MATKNYRIEKDSLGEVKVPKKAFFCHLELLFTSSPSGESTKSEKSSIPQTQILP